MESESLSLIRNESGVFILNMHNLVDNKFSINFINDLNKALDIIEGSKGSAALVTIGQSKFYSNGLDLAAVPTSGITMSEYLYKFQHLISRVLYLGIPTIAAINGHAFAGGWMFAMAHDFRVMRSDRGYLCLNEIHMGVALPYGLSRLYVSKVNSNSVLTRIILNGERFNAQVAKKLGLVDDIETQEKVFTRALDIAEKIKDKAKSRDVYKEMKMSMYSELFSSLDSAPLFIDTNFSKNFLQIKK